MALTACYECGAAISDHARHCPRCGAPHKLLRVASVLLFLILLALLTLAVMEFFFGR